jgi:hypothetical protein
VEVFRPAPNDPGDVSLSADVPGLPSVRIRSPFAAPLVAGATYLTRGEPTATSPGLAAGCNDPEGRLDVLEVEQDSRRVITRLAARYEVQCDQSGGPQVFGEVRLEARTGFRAAVATPAESDLGVVRRDLGEDVTLTLRSTGSDPVAFQAARGTGDRAGDVRVKDDGCAGRSLPRGQTCDVVVSIRPAARGRQTALVEVPDDTRAGRRLVRVTYDGADLPGPPTKVTPYAEPRRTGVGAAAPADDGGQRVESYRTYVSRAGGPFVAREEVYAGTQDDVGRGEAVRYAVSAVTRAGEGPRSEVVTATAPDTEVAYEGFGRERTLVLRAADTGRESSLTAGYEPAVSPDGNRVAFVRGGQLHVADRVPPRAFGAQDVRVLTSGEDVSTPAWTPDGRSLVVSRRQPGIAGDELVVVDVAGGEPRRVPGGDNAFEPAVSPSGTHVVFVDARPGTGQLAVLPLAGGERRLLRGTDRASAPTFTPDGQSILFSRFVDSQRNSLGATRSRSHLVAVPPRGGDTRVVVDLPGDVDDSDVTYDGRTVYFAYLALDDDAGASDLWSAPLDRSSAPRQFVTGTHRVAHPSVVGPGPAPVGTGGPRRARESPPPRPAPTARR